MAETEILEQQIPRKFLELSRKSENGSLYQLSTAQLSLRSTSSNGTLDLISIVHLGEREYFEAITDDVQPYDRVLHELVVNADSIDADDLGRRRLKYPANATVFQQTLASRYGLTHQLSGMNFTNSKWFVADLSRETIDKLQTRFLRSLEEPYVAGVQNLLLAQAARRQGREAMTSWFLQGGTESSWGPKGFSERVLLTCVAIVSLALPSPELSALLISWTWQNNGNANLQTFFDVLRLCANLDFVGARRLVYAQFLVSSQDQETGGVYEIIIGGRNSAAMKQVETLEKDGCRRSSLIYGVLHMPDLLQRLHQREYIVIDEPKWRDAWRISLRDQDFTHVAAATGVALLFGFGCLDWLDLVRDATDSLDCLVYGQKTIIWSTWPRTEINVPVTEYLQCPASGVWGRTFREGLVYVLRHIYMFWTLRELILR
eukprot:CAMPEP_0184306698 /NCGR_PEP_ID=MMETSP1049-20130417/15627_1 /TAXON_ID=77928 /ORGANISM="Proteomonas sulcata, Strain CCMP704" /LENGTH=430 /DNA_ID=CAMNT_0026619017 /DNA_START=96 /DNA_END=1388 /DNA_ORIENTATION=+